MKKIIFVISVLSIYFVFGQENVIKQIKAPEANTLSKFVNTPEGDYTGTTSFSIPLYEININGYTLPLSLKYHASGIQVDEISGKYGLGWVLDFGGISLSYQKYGKEDTNLWVPKIADLGSLNSVDSPMNKFAFYASTSLFPEDSQPDIFEYQIPNNSGKFSIYNKQIIKFPPSDIKLDQNFLNTAFSSLNGLKNLTPTITDTNGTVYTFGNPNISYADLSNSTTIAVGQMYSSLNWNINTIKTANAEINFLYESNNYNYLHNIRYSKDLTVELKQDPNYVGSSCYTSGSGTIEDKITNSVKDNLLKTIIFPEGKVEFIYNSKTSESRNDIPEHRFLKEINVYNRNNLIKNIKLNYSYFFTSAVNSGSSLTTEQKNTENRLRLDNVTDSMTGKYEIDYYLPAADEELPSRLASKDYWGFYNGQSPTNNNITQINYEGETYGVTNRQSNLYYTKFLSLKSLKYPTGGVHSIEYELNDYYVGGTVRVADSINSRTFSGDNIAAPGLFGSVEIDIDNVTSGKHTFAFGSSQTIPSNPDQIIQGENYMHYIMQLYDGNNQLIYTTSSAVESVANFQLAGGNYKLKIGKTAHYNDAPNHYYEFVLESRIPQYTMIKNNPSGGLRTSRYKITDNQVLKYDVSFDYNKPNTDKSSGISFSPLTTSLIMSNTPKMNNTADGSPPTPAYNESCEHYILTNDNNGLNLNVVGKGNVGYEYVTKKFHSVENSSGYSIAKKFYVDYDSSFNQVTNYGALGELVAPRFLSNKNGSVLKETYFNDSNDSIKIVKYEYGYDNHYNTMTPIQGLEQDYILSGSTYNRTSFKHKPGSMFIQNSTTYGAPYYNYSAYRYVVPSTWVRLLRRTTDEKLNGKFIHTVTDYNYNSDYQHLNHISEMTTAANETVNKTIISFATEKNNQLMISKNMIGIPLETEIKKDNKTLSKTETLYPTSQWEADAKTSGLVLPYQVNSTDLLSVVSAEATYDRYDAQGNILQYTTKGGVSTTIIWGYNNTQPIARVEGAKLSDISQSLIDAIVSASNTDAYAAPANDEIALLSTLNTFRTDASLAGYQITTYTYDPLIGVRSITPPSGIREVYIYDSAGRLKEVREQSQSGKLLKEYQYNYKH
ncbi:MAG: hypothetical protein DI622_09285 [Chryseobacterium sp.]|uniref:hypothetical protein n=1 Tax=Chryseobacterium sp. TaxID=1871047 RepID=UPI000DB898D5|nr:hypothetical protein [Chryseobacterium sp.]MPS66731.1 hypothetical protein [Chryseobacterium sp.]PZU19021.1 MAG: hypothetical protein DI622_09285 [Chryseobacterium sp.]